MLHFFSACSKQLINKILLPFTSDLWCLIDLRGTIWMIDHCFFDFEQSHIHRSLCWHIPIRSFSLDQITIVSHPLKQLVLTSLHAILSKNLCKLSDQNLRIAFCYSICKHFFWLHMLIIFKQCCIFILKLFNCLVSFQDS